MNDPSSAVGEEVALNTGAEGLHKSMGGVFIVSFNLLKAMLAGSLSEFPSSLTLIASTSTAYGSGGIGGGSIRRDRLAPRGRAS